MSADLTSAIESLYAELETLTKRANEIKKNINSLSALMGKEQPFTDSEFSSIGNSANIRPDQFFGKGLATAVKEYLKMRGQAVTAKEIYDALKTGGFEFTGNKNEAIQYRNLAISLGKNSSDFVYVKSSNAYGLWEFYPDKKREKRKADVLIDEKLEVKKEEKES
ncbi:MAG: hypothetical protein NTZ27_08355 [Ignavibacteriales bacterium]|nr:hypothetical protein [Ignavibacteriales bacterium]